MPSYINYTKFLIVWIFLVIVAGAVVRTTQSGMGCPDWPTCFGKWIPPTNASELPANYETYLKQQTIDHSFNAVHTWVEYLNRLLGAVLGIWVFIYFIWTYIKFSKTNGIIFFLALALLLATGFQGWLGKKVVDANLAVIKITLHMLFALIIAAIPVYILDRLTTTNRIENKTIRLLSAIAFGMLILQILMGTEVRQQIDIISKRYNYVHRELWVGLLDKWFDLHRFFSVAVFLICAFIQWKVYHIRLSSEATNHLYKSSLVISVLVIIIIALGTIMALFNVPVFAQPMHLLFSSILVIVLFAFRLKLK